MGNDFYSVPEIFKTKRQFLKKYPSRLFICTHCGKIGNNPYTCLQCGWRADGLFKTMEKGYRYIIEENSIEIQEIFIPIELTQHE